ncbi:MAG: hypothetical protein P8R42_14885 [Candidatus Binatia bacterium]|nr:hypothetical protein [Candidatus Binatia bacterium]
MRERSTPQGARDAPTGLSIAIGASGIQEEPAIVWWLGDRVVARCRNTLDLSEVSSETLDTGVPLRVTVGEGNRDQQMRVWRVED